MLGQHIFMRSRNEQNLVGTWTAAVTEGILNPKTVKDEVEPRCNIAESFAQEALTGLKGNHILRIYPLEDAVVVARTYWENDRISGDMGRKGVYTFSHIVTGEDAERYCGDFYGAFDPSCFETYDEVYQRMQQNGSERVVLNPAVSLFSHKEGRAGADIFRRSGFQKDTFSALMEGLYEAVSGNGKIAVLLPEPLRKAWETSGDNTAEELMKAVLELLPPPLRRRTGMVSHWNCSVHDKMLSSMHLVFVHPERPGDMDALNRGNVKIVDLDTGRYTTAAKITASEYFGFMWDSLEQSSGGLLDPGPVEQLWNYSAENCGDLISRIPDNSYIPEAVYTFRDTRENGYADAVQCRKAYLTAAEIFAGSGRRIPAADEMITSCLNAIPAVQKQEDPEILEAARRFIRMDKEDTSHQRQEYELILDRIFRNAAEEEDMELLLSELSREKKNAAPVFTVFFRGLRHSVQSKPADQLLDFTEKVFQQTAADTKDQDKDTQFFGNAKDQAELLTVVTSLLRSWAAAAVKEEDGRLLERILGIFLGYLEQGGNSTEVVSDYDSLLFQGVLYGNESYRNFCLNQLDQAELAFYKDPDRRTKDGQKISEIFCSAMSCLFPMPEDIPMSARAASYDRLLRMQAFLNDEQQQLAGLLQKEMEALDSRNNPQQFHSLFASQKRAVKDMQKHPELWNADRVWNCAVQFEQMLLSVSDTYVPDEERLTFVRNTIGWKNESEICSVLLAYLERMDSREQDALCHKLREEGRLEQLYLYALKCPDAEPLWPVPEKFLDADPLDRIRFFNDRAIPAQLPEELVKNRFRTWYESDVQQKLLDICNQKDVSGETPETETAGNTDKIALYDRCIAFLYGEYERTQSVASDPFLLKEDVTAVLHGKSQALIEGIDPMELSDLPEDAIEDLYRMVHQYGCPCPQDKARSIWKLHELDETGQLEADEPQAQDPLEAAQDGIDIEKLLSEETGPAAAGKETAEDEEFPEDYEAPKKRRTVYAEPVKKASDARYSGNQRTRSLKRRPGIGGTLIASVIGAVLFLVISAVLAYLLAKAANASALLAVIAEVVIIVLLILLIILLLRSGRRKKKAGVSGRR